jgi:drug/metabolite transporter (DMT)-like permease
VPGRATQPVVVTAYIENRSWDSRFFGESLIAQSRSSRNALADRRALEQHWSTATGAIACLAAATSYGVSYVYTRRFPTGRGTSPIALAASQITVRAAILIITAPVVAAQAVDLQLDVVASVLALGALGTGLAYLLNYRLLQDEGVTAASTVTYLLPIVAVILGAMVLGEPITWNLFAGTAIVLAGVAMSDSRGVTRLPLQRSYTSRRS